MPDCPPFAARLPAHLPSSAIGPACAYASVHSQPGSASCADGMQAAYAQMQTVDANGFRAFSIGSKPPVIPSLIARC